MDSIRYQVSDIHIPPFEIILCIEIVCKKSIPQIQIQSFVCFIESMNLSFENFEPVLYGSYWIQITA